jgi:hypothetical protein
MPQQCLRRAQIRTASACPHRELAYDGADWGKVFVLDERDRLSEYNP